jgi:hypothetical protein
MKAENNTKELFSILVLGFISLSKNAWAIYSLNPLHPTVYVYSSNKQCPFVDSSVCDRVF